MRRPGIGMLNGASAGIAYGSIALLALSIAGCAGPSVGPDEAAARTAFQAADAALSGHSDGYSLDDDPQAPAFSNGSGPRSGTGSSPT